MSLCGIYIDALYHQLTFPKRRDSTIGRGGPQVAQDGESLRGRLPARSPSLASTQVELPHSLPAPLLEGFRLLTLAFNQPTREAKQEIKMKTKKNVHALFFFFLF